VLTPPKASFTQITKHPLVYALIFIAGIAGWFVNSSTNGNADRMNDCNLQIEAWKKLYTDERKANLQLQTELFIKNNIIQSTPATLDSLVNVKKKELRNARNN